jgi:hypothetical protein
MSAKVTGATFCAVVAAAAVASATWSDVAGRASSGAKGPTPLSAAVKKQLQTAKAATAKYKDVAAAIADGYRAPPASAYEPEGHCAASPPDPRLQGYTGGGMGIHYDNPALRAQAAKKGFDIRRPQQLNYIPVGDKLRLVAIEFYKRDADQNLATDDDRPKLFDQPFDGPMLGHYPGQPIHYDLHVWVFAHNPNGMFSTWNPSVRC